MSDIAAESPQRSSNRSGRRRRGGGAVAPVLRRGLAAAWRVKIRRKMNDADNEANARAVDSLINFETVKAFAAERRETDLYDNALQRYAGAAVLLNRQILRIPLRL